LKEDSTNNDNSATEEKKQDVERESDAQRPNKRQKTTNDDSEVDASNVELGGQLSQRIPHRSSTPLPTLPSFPSHAVPNAPPKSVLALQGLDRALVDAEIVDPTTSLPIPLEGNNDGGTCLTEKTRKRLNELGITELFAGLVVYSSFFPNSF
jgi:ATP-dependent RNA helicase DDX51/DBP6